MSDRGLVIDYFFPYLMHQRNLTLLLLGIFILSLPAQAVLPSPASIEADMRLANDYWQANNTQGAGDWLFGAYHTGNFKAGLVLGESDYIDYSRQWGVINGWKIGGPWPVWSRSNSHRLHGDSHVAGQTWLDLSLIDNMPAYRDQADGIEQAMDDLLANVSWNDGRGNTVDNDSTDDWWWIDAFYMAAPTLARTANLKDDESYRTQLREMYDWMKINRTLYDAIEGLWYRDESFLDDISPNGEPVFWSRGNGWVMAGLARVLEQLPSAHPDRPEFEARLQDMAAALVPLQGADGFWRSNLKDPNHYTNPETSGTSFFTAAIAYGLRTGILDEATYLAVLEAAWNGLTTIALQPNGFLGYIQDVGAGPAGASSTSTQSYGLGAYLLAGSEILLLLDAEAAVVPNAGPDQSFDLVAGSYETTVILDATGSIIQSGTLASATWWTGDIFLAEGMQADVTLPEGDWPITLKLLMENEATYEDHCLVRISGSSGTEINPASLSASSWQDPNVPANTRDGNFATRWSAEGDGQWIQYDFGSTLQVASVNIAFYDGSSRTAYFDILFSNDALSWNTVLASATSSGTSTDLETFPTSDLPARYVRIVGHGNSVNTWNSLTEVTFSRPATSTDEDGNGLPDDWELARLGSAGNPTSLDSDKDGDSDETEFIMGTDPMDPASKTHLVVLKVDASTLRLRFMALAAIGPGYSGLSREFTIMQATTLSPAAWSPLSAAVALPGNNLITEIDVAVPASPTFWQLDVQLTTP